MIPSSLRSHPPQGKELAVLEPNSLGNHDLAVSKDGRFVSVASFTSEVKVWELKYGKEVTEFKGEGEGRRPRREHLHMRACVHACVCACVTVYVRVLACLPQACACAPNNAGCMRCWLCAVSLLCPLSQSWH